MKVSVEGKETRAEARAKRMQELPWVKELMQKLALYEKANSEISRFCKKFGFLPEDLKARSISDAPYVSLSVTVPLTVMGMEHRIEVSNIKYEDVGEKPDYYEVPKFHDLSQAIAKALAEIFSGKVKEVYNFDRQIAYLTVQTEDDAIEVDGVYFKECKYFQ